MHLRRASRAVLIGGLALALSGCGGNGFAGRLFSRNTSGTANPTPVRPAFDPNATSSENVKRSTVFDIFQNRADPNTTVEVNRYIWNASLDVLSFLPVQSVDPFSGVIVTGYGRPPGGGRAYRATIYVKDPALEARSLTVALQSQSGPVSAETARAVEDAILTRARQLRIQDAKL